MSFVLIDIAKVRKLLADSKKNAKYLSELLRQAWCLRQNRGIRGCGCRKGHKKKLSTESQELLSFNVVIWSWSFGHFRFRERGHCSLYINNKLFIYSGEFWQSVFDFDQMTLTKWPRLDTQLFCEKTIFSCEVFVNRNENVVPLQRQMKEVAEAAIKDKNCKH